MASSCALAALILWGTVTQSGGLDALSLHAGGCFEFLTEPLPYLSLMMILASHRRL
jgi:hypothetical protein